MNADQKSFFWIGVFLRSSAAKILSLNI